MKGIACRIEDVRVAVDNGVERPFGVRVHRVWHERVSMIIVGAIVRSRTSRHAVNSIAVSYRGLIGLTFEQGASLMTASMNLIVRTLDVLRALNKQNHCTLRDMHEAKARKRKRLNSSTT